MYNIGGGIGRTLLLLELIDYIEHRLGKKPNYSYEKTRDGDQLVFISDTAKAKTDLDWTPQITVEDGLGELYDWIIANKETLKEIGI